MASWAESSERSASSLLGVGFVEYAAVSVASFVLRLAHALATYTSAPALSKHTQRLASRTEMIRPSQQAKTGHQQRERHWLVMMQWLHLGGMGLVTNATDSMTCWQDGCAACGIQAWKLGM